ncbi:MAG: DNA repair protein RadC [Bacteroidia bacterium]|nr:DNA repair protein RadC [Bacteroidia bacterium]
MNSEFKAINKWAEDDRPREKLITKGKNTLSDAELIAIILGSGSRNESAVELSKRILAENGNNLFNLSKVGISELCKFKGMGEAKAVGLIAAMELGVRQRGAQPERRPKITCSKDAFDQLSTQFSDAHLEEFHILLLNRANEVTQKHFISRGGMTGTVADVRVIARLAIEGKATGVVISHNHPSGQLKPSIADVEITKKVKMGLNTLDIELLDHIILAGNSYFSFCDDGIL